MKDEAGDVRRGRALHAWGRNGAVDYFFLI